MKEDFKDPWQEALKEALTEASKEASKEALKEALKEPWQVALTENLQEVSNEVIKEAVKDPWQEALKEALQEADTLHLHYTLYTSGDFLNWFRKSIHRFDWFAALNSNPILLGFFAGIIYDFYLFFDCSMMFVRIVVKCV